MLKKLPPYLPIFLLIFAVVGCTGLSTQYRGSHNKRGTPAMTSETRSAGNTEKDIQYNRDEIVKQQIKYSKREAYLVDSNDVLDIVAFEEPDLSVELIVSEKGTISYPLIGEIEVRGLTIYEVEKILEKRLRDGEYLKNPDLTVRLDLEMMKRWGDKEVFVMGEVEGPGPIPIMGKNITVLESVAKAGGFTEFAAPNRTIIIRIEDGVEKTIKVNLNKVRRGDKGLDITLRAGDVVIVPETYF